MAKIKFGAVVADARGKADGIVYSRNQFGAYVRPKVSPVQPNSHRQTLVRERLTGLAKAYASEITEPQRAAWNAFSKVNPVTDVFGASQNLTGINTYVRLNGVLLNLGVARIDTPPPSLFSAGLLSASAVASAGGGTIAITFADTPLPATAHLYVFATQGLQPGRSFFRPFMRFLVAGTAATTSPFAAGAAYVAKFGSLVEGSAIGLEVGIADDASGAVTKGIFIRVIVGA